MKVPSSHFNNKLNALKVDNMYVHKYTIVPEVFGINLYALPVGT